MNPLLHLSLMAILLNVAVSHADEKTAINSTAAPCSPIVTDTQGNVSLNINCPIYSGTDISKRFLKAADLLRRGQDRPPAFARPSGPIWIDFEAGFHPFSVQTASAVQDALKQNRVYAVEGSLYSWREQFVRFLAWSFSQHGEPVFITDAREWGKEDRLSLNWADYDQLGTVIFVDNAQFNPDMVRDFIYLAESNTRVLRVVVAFDGNIRNVLEPKPFSQHLLLTLPRMQLDPRKVGSTLVERYSAKLYGREVGTRVISAILDASSGANKRATSFFYRPSFDPKDVDLWKVAGILSIWDGLGIPDIDHIKGNNDLIISNVVNPIIAENVELGTLIAVVSFFSELDTAIPREFITLRLKFSTTALNRALQLGLVKIIEPGLILALPGSAGLFWNAFTARTEISLDLGRRLSSSNLSEGLVTQILNFGLYDYGALLLNFESEAQFEGKLDVATVNPKVAQLIAADDSAGRVGRALIALKEASKPPEPSSPARLLLNGGPGAMPALADRTGAAQQEMTKIGLSVERNLNRLFEKTSSLKEVAWLLVGIREFNPPLSQHVAQSLNSSVLAQRIASEEDVGKIASFIWALNQCDHDAATRLLTELQLNILQERVKSEVNPAKIGWLLEVMASVSTGRASSLVTQIPVDSLTMKVGEHLSTADLSDFLIGLSAANSVKARLVLRALDPDELRRRMIEEHRTRVLAMYLLAIGNIDSDLSASVLLSVGLDQVKGLLQSENDPIERGLLVSGIRSAYKAGADVLIGPVKETSRAAMENSRRAVIQFSSQCPYCMAAAESQLAIATELNQAETYFDRSTLLIPGFRNIFETNPTSELLKEAQKYEPATVRTLIREETWDKIIKLYGDAAQPRDKTNIAMSLFDANPARFRAWMSSEMSSRDGAEHIIVWHDVDSDGLESYLRQLSREQIIALFTSAPSTDVKQVAELLWQANPPQIRELVLNSGASIWASNIDPDTAVHFNPALILWSVATKTVDRGTARELFRYASAEELARIFGALARSDITLARELLTAAIGSNGIQTNIRSIREGLDFLEVVLARFPEQSDEIIIGGERVGTIKGNFKLISNALPCSRPADGDDDASPAKLARLHSLLERFLFFKSAVAADDFPIAHCLEAMAAYGPETARELIDALGVTKIIEVATQLPGIAGELLAEVHSLSPGNRTEIESFVRRRIEEEPSLGLSELQAMQQKEPAAVSSILDTITREQLANWISGEVMTDAEDSLKALNAISPDIAKDVIRFMELNKFVRDLEVDDRLARYSGLAIFARLVGAFEEIDGTAGEELFNLIRPDQVEAALARDDFWPEDFLARLAKVRPEVALASFSERVMAKFYDHKSTTSFVEFDSAEKLMRALRKANAQVWAELIGRIDLTRVAESMRLYRETNGYKSYTIGRFLAELARLDVRRIKNSAIIREVPPDDVNDLERDFPPEHAPYL